MSFPGPILLRLPVSAGNNECLTASMMDQERCGLRNRRQTQGEMFVRATKNTAKLDVLLCCTVSFRWPAAASTEPRVPKAAKISKVSFNAQNSRGYARKSENETTIRKATLLSVPRHLQLFGCVLGVRLYISRMEPKFIFHGPQLANFRSCGRARIACFINAEKGCR